LLQDANACFYTAAKNDFCILKRLFKKRKIKKGRGRRRSSSTKHVSDPLQKVRQPLL
jgi:hypothetical protein